MARNRMFEKNIFLIFYLFLFISIRGVASAAATDASSNESVHATATDGPVSVISTTKTEKNANSTHVSADDAPSDKLSSVNLSLQKSRFFLKGQFGSGFT